MTKRRGNVRTIDSGDPPAVFEPGRTYPKDPAGSKSGNSKLVSARLRPFRFA